VPGLRRTDREAGGMTLAWGFYALSLTAGLIVCLWVDR
jgi:hypothetical protein